MGVSTSTTTVRSSTPTAGYAIGATAALLVELPRSRAITGWARGQGQRNTAPRRSPSRLLATETSPRPRTLARCLLSRPPLSRPVRSDVGRERYRRRAACLHGAPQRGPCGDELPRRNPTFTSPRHLPSRDRSRANEGFLRGSKLPWSCADTFFTAGEPGGGTPNSDPDGSAPRTRAGEPATSSKDRSAPRDFCVRVEDRGQIDRKSTRLNSSHT